MAWFLADRVLVMYRGRIVEMGPLTDILERLRHRCTHALLSIERCAREMPLLRGLGPQHQAACHLA